MPPRRARPGAPCGVRDSPDVDDAPGPQRGAVALFARGSSAPWSPRHKLANGHGVGDCAHWPRVGRTRSTHRCGLRPARPCACPAGEPLEHHVRIEPKACPPARSQGDRAQLVGVLVRVSAGHAEHLGEHCRRGPGASRAALDDLARLRVRALAVRRCVRCRIRVAFRARGRSLRPQHRVALVALVALPRTGRGRASLSGCEGRTPPHPREGNLSGSPLCVRGAQHPQHPQRREVALPGVVEVFDAVAAFGRRRRSGGRRGGRRTCGAGVASPRASSGLPRRSPQGDSSSATSASMSVSVVSRSTSRSAKMRRQSARSWTPRLGSRSARALLSATAASRARSGQSSAGGVGDREEWFPDVGGAVGDARRASRARRRGASSTCSCRPCRRAGRGAVSASGRTSRSRNGSTCSFGARRFIGDDDGAVEDRVGEVADAGERAGGEGGELDDLTPCRRLRRGRRWRLGGGRR